MLLQVEAVGLAGLSVVLAGPASAALSRAAWPASSPRAALLLWQSIGLGGGLGVLTAGLTLAASGMDGSWPAAVAAVPSHARALGLAEWAGVALTVCFGAWLVSASAAATGRVLRSRRIHRRRLDLIAEARQASTHPAHRRGGTPTLRMVDFPMPLAYCLPGVRPQVIVSKGAFETLTEQELIAVLAHEHAHARGRHDLVVQPFIAWARTFPFLGTAHDAVASVRTLVEMLADDRALRRCAPQDLRTALRRIALDQAEGLGTDDPARGLSRRLRRIDHPAALPTAATALVYVAAAALVAGPPIVLLCS